MILKQQKIEQLFLDQENSKSVFLPDLVAYGICVWIPERLGYCIQGPVIGSVWARGSSEAWLIHNLVKQASVPKSENLVLLRVRPGTS
jgi:hypothetical protein